MRTLLLGDIGNRLDIEDAEREILRLKARQDGSTKAQASRIVRLERELAEQRLATQALTRFLVERGIVDEAELGEFIREVDAEDGAVDGRLTVNPTSRKLQFPQRRIDPGTFRKTTDLDQGRDR
jgi:hypothetical protein